MEFNKKKRSLRSQIRKNYRIDNLDKLINYQDFFDFLLRPSLKSAFRACPFEVFGHFFLAILKFFTSL